MKGLIMTPTTNIISPIKFINKLINGAKNMIKEDNISKYTTVSSAFRPEESVLIKENLEEISKYAQDNSCNLSFRPSYKHKDSFRMEVDKRVIKKHDFCDGSPEIEMEVLEKNGSALIPKSIQTSEELLNAIKTEASKLLYKQV